MEEMIPVAQVILSIIGSVIASSGFWAYLQKRHEKHDAKTALLVGLAHDAIITKGTFYLERGDWITVDEYENLHDYLYLPYARAGGNGSAKCVMEDIDRRLRRVRRPPSKEDNEAEEGVYLI